MWLSFCQTFLAVRASNTVHVWITKNRDFQNCMSQYAITKVDMKIKHENNIFCKREDIINS